MRKPIDIFTRERFENALPVHKTSGEKLWKSLGLYKGEYVYVVPVYEGEIEIIVRSSVGISGVSADTGEDSIRCWLSSPKTNLGKKMSRWTTRLPNWEVRLANILRKLYAFGRKLKCGRCGSIGIISNKDGRGPYFYCPKDKGGCGLYVAVDVELPN